ncbi:MAG: class I SAM-dependent methyltransferase [Actinomycetota bacterium]
MRRPHRAPHQIPRFSPVMRELRRLRAGAAVLEVGSGSEGIGTWWRVPFIGVDLVFEFGRPPTLIPLYGNAMRLPVKEGAFDLVVCVAVLLHFEGERSIETACAELARAARGRVIVVTPAGRAAHESDLRMLEWCKREGIEPKPWLLHQISYGELPEEQVIDALRPFGPVQVGTTMSVPWNERFFRAEQRMRQLRGSMTVVQPALRAWGRKRHTELASGGPPYERVFVLDRTATVSPPRDAS